MPYPMPTGVSPRFSGYTEDFNAIAAALENVGHCVIEDVFNTQALALCRNYAAQLFQRLDTAYQNKKMTSGEQQAYFGTTYGFHSDQEGSYHLELFMDMIERSPLLDLFSFLLKGNIAAMHGPMLRRPNPTYPMMHLGLHCDGQVVEYAKQTARPEGEYTVWTPFCDVDLSAPGILLISNKFAHYSKNLKQFEDNKDIAFLFHHNAVREKFDSAEAASYSEQFWHHLSGLIKDYSADLYAPLLRVGSVVIIHRDIYYSDLVYPTMTQPRCSADIRFIGDFDKNINYVNKERGFIYKRYTRYLYDPYEQNTKRFHDLNAVIAHQQHQLYAHEDRLNTLQHHNQYPSKVLSQRKIRQKIRQMAKFLVYKLNMESMVRRLRQ